ncbi:MAG: hypothetical protein QOG12_274 [Verrucomicrobiota bacterium]
MSVTELDDLKAAWQTLNRTLERQNILALHQFKETKLGRFRSGLRPLTASQIVQLILGVILIGLAGQFWVKHVGTYHLMGYGIVLQVYGIMLAGFAVRDLILIHQLDYSAPVVTIQKQMAALRAWRLRAGTWFAVVGCFIWMPAILILFYWLGADLWVARPKVVSWFALNSVVCVLLGGAFIYWFRQGQSRFAKSLRESAAGRSVRRAQAVLDEIAEFEKE